MRNQTYYCCVYLRVYSWAVSRFDAAFVLVGCLSVSDAVQTMEGVDVMACSEHLRLSSVLKCSRPLVSD